MGLKRNIFVTGLMAAGALLLVSSGASAAVSGVCSTCHTMHASTDGVISTPNGSLLRGSGCTGCHAKGVDNSTTAMAVAGWAPQVTLASGASIELAGGAFTGYAVDSAANRHDVTNLGQTGGLAVTPGAALSGGFDPTTLGCESCHAKAGHHTNASGQIDGSSAGSYRFLGTDVGADVYGVEDDDWEMTASATTTDHNVYFGADVAVTGSNANTISRFCGGCHTDFHGDGLGGNDLDGVSNNAGAWIRHPTDLALGSAANTTLATTVYSNYTYDLTVPVASNSYTAYTTTTGAGANGIVMCLSCHRAHGSAYPDLLRYDYTAVQAGVGGTTGCLVCHGDK